MTLGMMTPVESLSEYSESSSSAYYAKKKKGNNKMQYFYGKNSDKKGTVSSQKSNATDKN